MDAISLEVAQLQADTTKLLSIVALRDVRLHALQATAGIEHRGGPLTVRQSIQVRGDQVEQTRKVRTIARYEVSAALPESADSAVDLVWEVIVELIAEYESPDSEAPMFTEQELAAISLVDGLATIHPFARETVQSTTARMGYPPFTLEAYSPIQGDETGRIVLDTTAEILKPEADSSAPTE